MSTRAVGELHCSLVKAKTVDAQRGVGIDSSSVACSPELLLIAAACIDVRTLGQIGGARDDVDDSVHRVRAPERGAHPADDLDSVYILQHDIKRVRINARIKRRVDAAPVDQYEQLVREILRIRISAESSRRYDVGAGGSLR